MKTAILALGIMAIIMLLVLTGFAWYITDLLYKWYLINTNSLHAYLIVETQEFLTCTPSVSARIVYCTPHDLIKYLSKRDNVKVTVTKLD